MSIEVVSTVQGLTGAEGFVGRHVLLDVRTSTPRGIGETTTVYHLLEGLSVALDMTLVYPPLVARFPFAGSEPEPLRRVAQGGGDPGERGQRDGAPPGRSGRTRRPGSPG